jgi:hypothetical protein
VRNRAARLKLLRPHVARHGSALFSRVLVDSIVDRTRAKP